MMVKSLHNVEFFFIGDELYYKQLDNGTVKPLNQENKDAVGYMFTEIKERYPKAYERLDTLHAESRPNKLFYRFLVVANFCGCNFGRSDGIPDIDKNGRWNIELVDCPRRVFCKDKGTVCSPKLNTGISGAEMRVIELFARGSINGKGYTKEQIAIKLDLSLNTIRNHIERVKARKGVTRSEDLVIYCQENIFK